MSISQDPNPTSVMNHIPLCSSWPRLLPTHFWGYINIPTFEPKPRDSTACKPERTKLELKQLFLSSLPAKNTPARLLKSCKYKLEKELADKLQALSIDDQCATLSENSAGIGLSQEGVKIQTK